MGETEKRSGGMVIVGGGRGGGGRGVGGSALEIVGSEEGESECEGGEGGKKR